jgi:predicted PurR-regulated permease PerM
VSPGAPLSGQGMPPEGNNIFFRFFLVLLLFSFYLLFCLMRPFLHSIILACVFTAISFPIYRRCLALTRGRRIPAALIVLSCITLLIAALVWLFVAGFVPQAKSSIGAMNQWLGGAHWSEVLKTHIEPFLLRVQEYVPEFTITAEDIRQNLTSLSSQAGQFLLRHATSLVGNTLLFFGNLLLVLLIMFFLFIDGEALVRRMAYLLPLKSAQTEVVMESLRKISRSVLVGGFSVAVLQGVAGGMGFAFVGIPALFWGAVMVFAAFVPVVGTGLVWGPAVIVLLIMGEWKSALFLALWCGILVTSIDSILRPVLLRGGAKLPVIFIFMSILGGINVFGVFGLLYGPMILGLVAVMLDIYADEFQEILRGRLGFGSGKQGG